MPSQELSNNVFPKGKGHPSVIFSPPNDVFVWIGPQEIAQKTRVWDVGGTHDALDLLHVLQLGTESPVHAEDLLVNDSGNRQAVEGVSECFPELDVVSSLAYEAHQGRRGVAGGKGHTLVVESVDSVDGGALVVPAENEEVLRIFDLVGEQQADGLERLFATIDIIPERIEGEGGREGEGQ